MKTIGLRCKSGFAIVLVTDGSREEWQIIGRKEVLLTDNEVRYARFPYHPLIELDAAAGVSVSESAVATVRREAQKQLSELLRSVGPVRGAGIVTGSLIDPARISNPHIRVHAREGQLFREVVAVALDRAGVPYQTLSDRDAYREVAEHLSTTEARLKDDLNGRGRSIVKPWRADEKLAAVGAIAARIAFCR